MVIHSFIHSFTYSFTHLLIHSEKLGYSATQIWPVKQNVFEGNSTLIVCESFNAPCWLHNGVPLKPSGEKIIYIDQVKKSDGGIYTCDGVHRDGTPFRVNSTLFVKGELLHAVE